MKSYVIDASVAAAAFFQESEASAAQAVLSADARLLAPDLISAEFANVLWKRRRRREITDEEAAQILGDFLRLPLEITPNAELSDLALELAMSTGRTVYDCLYLALAVRSKAILVTCDKRLVHALERTPLAGSVVGVGDVTR